MNSQSQSNPMKRVLLLRDFRLLFACASVSLLGDQFAMIATPWLALLITLCMAFHPDLKGFSESLTTAY